MKTHHYPSFELCKKLSDIWVPYSFELWITKEGEIFTNTEKEDLEKACEGIEFTHAYSVMELIDIIPHEIDVNWETKVPFISRDTVWYCSMNWNKNFYTKWLHWMSEYIPNSLAEMVLSLHDFLH